jgi:hypothetical protein
VIWTRALGTRPQSETGERDETTRGRLNHPEPVEAMDEALALWRLVEGQ